MTDPTVPDAGAPSGRRTVATDDTAGTEPLERHGPAHPAAHPAADDVRVEPAPGSADADSPELPPTGTARAPRERRDPVEALKDPVNRAKLLIAIAAVTVLNLILLVAVLVNVLGASREEVVVDGEPCVVVEQDGENVLYCAR